MKKAGKAKKVRIEVAKCLCRDSVEQFISYLLFMFLQSTTLTPTNASSALNAELLDVNSLLVQKEKVETQLGKIVGPPLPKKASQELDVPPAAVHWDHLLKEMVGTVYIYIFLIRYI
jgi:hypothetical protein